MPITYNENNHIFDRTEITTATGLQTDFIQAFYTNIFVDTDSQGALSFDIDLPSYNLSIGTTQYYAQNPQSILTTLSRPCLNFDFSGNTDSLTAVTLIHDIYRIDWDSYSNFLNCYEREKNNVINQTNSETIQESITENGVVTNKTTVRTLDSSQHKDSFNDKDCVTKQQIIDKITTPIISITASTSAITFTTYGLRIEEYVKVSGETEQTLFNDKDQFLINTRYSFEVPELNDVGKLNYYEDGELKTKILTGGTTNYSVTPGSPITGGTFFGTTVKGYYFNYFKIPNEPLLTGVIPSGQISSFAPKIQFTNVEDGDYYISQVNYNTGDTGFTGTVYTNTYEKSSTILPSGDISTRAEGDINDYGFYVETTDDTVREIGLVLKTQQSALYRIGSVKEVFNIFGVKQKVVTFSDSYSVITPVYNLSERVYIQSDSPNILTQATLDPDTQLDVSCYLDTGWVFSGTVVGSTVTGATVELRFPNGGSVSQTTDEVGYFIFDDLDTGTYQLTTTYRGYEIDVRDVSVTENTSLTYKINLLWSNDWDTWGKMANENYYTGP